MPIRSFVVALALVGLAVAAPADFAKEKAMKADLAGQAEGMRDQVQIMVDTIFSFGELGFQEFETSKYLIGILEAEGFTGHMADFVGRIKRSPTRHFLTWHATK